LANTENFTVGLEAFSERFTVQYRLRDVFIWFWCISIWDDLVPIVSCAARSRTAELQRHEYTQTGHCALSGTFGSAMWLCCFASLGQTPSKTHRRAKWQDYNHRIRVLIARLL